MLIHSTADRNHPAPPAMLVVRCFQSEYPKPTDSIYRIFKVSSYIMADYLGRGTSHTYLCTAPFVTRIGHDGGITYIRYDGTRYMIFNQQIILYDASLADLFAVHHLCINGARRIDMLAYFASRNYQNNNYNLIRHAPIRGLRLRKIQHVKPDVRGWPELLVICSTSKN